MATRGFRVQIVRGEDGEYEYSGDGDVQVPFRAYVVDDGANDARAAGRAYVRVVYRGTGPFRHASHALVKWIEVDKAFRQHRIGTKIYEAAAKDACKRFKVPLRSDTLRSEYSQRFWEKQAQKGRADCLETCDANTGCPRSAFVVKRGGCITYTLRCPAPRTLAGVPSRTRRGGR